MNESNKYSETDRFVCYKESDNSCELSMIFNKDSQTVDISLMMWYSNGEPILEPMNESISYSAKYGHWQSELVVLGMDDIEFLHKKSKELFN